MQPVVDIKNNPFYCPAVPAHSFISSLRRKRKSFRTKEHVYYGKRITLKPFAAALDRCLFRGGGDSDEDKQTSQSQQKSGTESSYDESNPFSAHISTLNATGRGFASIKKSLLRTALRRNAGDSDSFVTVPLAPTTKKGSSEFATLSDRSGKPLVTTRRNCSLAPHTLTIWGKLPLEHSPRAANLKRKSSESEFTFDSGTKRARSTLSVDESSYYVTVPPEPRFVYTPPTSPLILSSKSFEFLPRRPAVDHELRAGTHIPVPRFKNWDGPLALEGMRNLNRDDLLEFAGALQGSVLSAYFCFSDPLADELLGPILGPETETQILVEKLDSMLPGIRIRERLIERLKSGPSHQSIIDFFAENGGRYSRALTGLRITMYSQDF